MCSAIKSRQSFLLSHTTGTPKSVYSNPTLVVIWTWLSMMPGMGKLKVNENDVDEKKIEHTKAIILSMTKQERDNPAIIDSKRKRRIAAGSGTSVQEVNQLLKQFEQTKMLMKQLKGGKGRLRLPF